MLSAIKKNQGQTAMTLVELLVASAILILAVTGILISYLKCLELNEIAHNSSIATQAAKSRVEQIRSTAFNQIAATYNNIPFDLTGLTGKGVSYVNTTDPNLYVVTVSVSWKLKNGRVFGEDLNLNGQLNTGEDKNGNGILDSPVEIVTNIFER